MSVYDTVTNRIIEELEQGTVPWVKPWKTTLPYNAVSEKAYSGVNILLLWSLPHAQPAWLTFKQAQGFGGYVKKGEKATPILYASTYRKKGVDASGEEAEQEIPFLKWYFVFNIEQCEGLPDRLYGRPVLTTDETYEEENRFRCKERRLASFPSRPHPFRRRLRKEVRFPSLSPLSLLQTLRSQS